MIQVEVRGTLSDEIATLLPQAKENPNKSWTDDVNKEAFLTAIVDEVEPCKSLFNVVCRSVNLLINKRIAQELQGGTVCVGYLEHTKPQAQSYYCFSPLVLILCRRVHLDDEYVVFQGKDDAIDEIKPHMAIGRDRLRYAGGIWKESTLIHFTKLCHFSSFIRMNKCIQELFRLTEKIPNTLCGPRNRLPSVQRQPNQDAEWEEKIDDGCASYFKAVKESTNMIDESQLRALKSVLVNVGDCEKNSSSMSLIQGPPGTGKTTVINLLVGALLSHSNAGHIGRDQINILKNVSTDTADNILSCSTNEMGLKILICCPSNQAVDNDLRKLHEDGIPDGKGASFRPQAVRLARRGHDFGDIHMYSINSKALPFDKFLHHRHEIDRTTSSSATRRSFSKECLIVFSTLCSSGGSRLKELRMRFDVVIVDEAGQCLEPECLISLTTVMKNSVLGRLHAVLVGDSNQLAAAVKGENVIANSNILRFLNYKEQTKSLLERLFREERSTLVMLTRQYRMHPCISEMHSPIFYNGAVKSPLSAVQFRSVYNRGCDDQGKGFALVTFIDTRFIPDRFEINDGQGSVVNPMEVNIIDEILEDLKRLSGNRFETLRNQVAVIVPYRAQVDHARIVLERLGKYKEGECLSRQGFQIKIDTVDSMQGSQRDIVIFGGTRSNTDIIVGFVDHPNRLNVAISRARKLFVVVADMSTLRNTSAFGKMWDYCIAGCNGTAMLVRRMREGETSGTCYTELIVDQSQIPHYS